MKVIGRPRGFPITFTPLHGNTYRTLKINYSTLAYNLQQEHIIVYLEKENYTNNTGMLCR